MSGHQGNVTELTKVCGKCGAPKPLIDFQVRNKSTGSRSAWCRACHTAHTKAKRHSRLLQVRPLMQGQKVCNTCKSAKEASEFHRSKGMPDGLQPFCRTCGSVKSKKWYDMNREKVLGRVSKSMRKVRYGLSDEAYVALKQAQGYRCAICRTQFDDLRRAPSVDHCHETNKIRGLLCSPCNTGIGLLRENEEILNKAITYLRKSKGVE